MFSYEEYAKIRNKKNMKDSDVSRAAKIPQSTFSDWKKGKSYPKSDKLLKIANALECDPSAFLSAVFGTDLIYTQGSAQEKKSEPEIIMQLYEESDDYTKELVKRLLNYDNNAER